MKLYRKFFNKGVTYQEPSLNLDHSADNQDKGRLAKNIGAAGFAIGSGSLAASGIKTYMDSMKNADINQKKELNSVLNNKKFRQDKLDKFLEDRYVNHGMTPNKLAFARKQVNKEIADIKASNKINILGTAKGKSAKLYLSKHQDELKKIAKKSGIKTGIGLMGVLATAKAFKEINKKNKEK